MKSRAATDCTYIRDLAAALDVASHQVRRDSCGDWQIVADWIAPGCKP